MHQGEAEVGRGIGPRTVMTWPERTWAGARAQGIALPPHATGGFRAREDAGVEPDRDEDDRAGDDLGEERRDVREDQAVADDGDGERAEDGAEDRAAAAHERGAAEDDGGDHLQLEADGGVRRARAEAGGDDEAGEGGGDPREHVDRGDDPSRRHADTARRLGVASRRRRPGGRSVV